MKRYVISIDCGTQSVRALLFDQQGTLVHKVKCEFEPYVSSHPGYAEQDPDIYYHHIISALSKLKIEQPTCVQYAEGLCMTVLRDTGVFLDKELHVLRPSILWLDQRMAACKRPLSILSQSKFKVSGMTRAIDMTRKLSKTNWVKEHEPDVWEKTKYFVMLPAYLQYKLTGILVDTIGNQIGHVPFNYKKQKWPLNSKDYRWEVFGIESDKLSPLISTGSVIGNLLPEVIEKTGLPPNIKIIGGASDKGCETLGVGCIDVTQASLSFGTTATIQTTSKHYFEPLLFMPAYPAAIPGRYSPEVQIFRGYWMIRWFKNEFAAREEQEAIKRGIAPEILLNECLKNIPPGSEGLILQPYWTPGLKQLDAKGAVIGFSEVHTRAHLYKAIIEGINYGLMEGLIKIEKKSHVKVSQLMVSGGGSQCDEICQITADMFNLPVYKGETYEAAGLGAAILCFVGLGIYPDYEIAVVNMVRYGNVFYPQAQNAALYNTLFNRVYLKIFSHLKDLYSEISKIQKNEEKQDA